MPCGTSRYLIKLQGKSQFYIACEIYTDIVSYICRGALGATLLLFRTKGRSLAALGALIIVLLLAIDTFFQQVVEFPDRWALQNTTSAIPRVVKYEPVYIKEFWQEYENNQYNKDLRPVIQEYLYNNGTKPTPFGNGTRPDIPLSCPTSNCTWPAYETFAVCSNCVDVSDSLELTFTCLNTTIDWTVKWTGPLRDVPYPNGTVCGYFLNATSTAPTLISGYTISDDVANSTAGEALLVRALPLTKFLTRERLYETGSINFNSIRNPIMDFLLASAPNGSRSVYREERPIVHECLLSWCVQTMRSSYDYGRYHETIETTHQNNTAGLSPWISFKLPKEDGVGQVTEYLENITIIPPVSRLDHFPLTIANAEYGLNNDTANNVMMIFDDFFPSYYTTLSESDVPQLRHKEYEDGPYRRILPFNPWLAPNNITRHVERLATAMTNVIRSSSSQEMLLGDAYQKENYVKIKWEWLSFPIALLILSLVFLVSTIIRTSRDGEIAVWKTSAMPTLISSLPQDVQKELLPSRIDKSVSRKVRIKLLPDQGWRVSRQLCASPTSDRNGHHGPPAFV
jgi:hypothetical protein